MKNYHALRSLILRGLSQTDSATIDNVFTCLVEAQKQVDRAHIPLYDEKNAKTWLNKAAQHLWGSFPPENVKISENWEYDLKD